MDVKFVFWLYPDDSNYYLRRKIAERHGCRMENVFAASGSAEAIELAAIAFLEPGDEVVTSEHTFAIWFRLLKIGELLVVNNLDST